MKHYLTGLAAVAVAATLAYGAPINVASAATVACPEGASDRTFYLTTDPASTCVFDNTDIGPPRALTGGADDHFLNSDAGDGFEFLTKWEGSGSGGETGQQQTWIDANGVLEITGLGSTSGTFTITSDLVLWQFAIGFKSGFAQLEPDIAVFLLPLTVTSGDWSISGSQGLSHVVLYGNPTVIPLPVPVVLLGSALMGLGFLGWRRRRTIAA